MHFKGGLTSQWEETTATSFIGQQIGLSIITGISLGGSRKIPNKIPLTVSSVYISSSAYLFSSW